MTKKQILQLLYIGMMVTLVVVEMIWLQLETLYLLAGLLWGMMAIFAKAKSKYLFVLALGIMIVSAGLVLFNVEDLSDLSEKLMVWVYWFLLFGVVQLLLSDMMRTWQKGKRKGD